MSADGSASGPAALDRICGVLVALIGFLLPFQAVGTWAPRIWPGLAPVDAAILAASPFVAAAALRSARTLVRSHVLWACVALASVELLSAAIHGGSGFGVRDAVRPLPMLVVVAGAAAVCLTPSGLRRLVLAICAGGAVAVGVSIVGFFAHSGWSDGVQPFYYVGGHPLLGRLPRLSGTFGHSPQHFGEYLVFLMTAAALSLRVIGGRLGWILLGAAAAALGLAFSYAWVGGVVIAAGMLLVSRGGRSTVTLAGVAVAALAAVAGTWLVNVGLPGDFGGPGFVAVDCGAADFEHHVTTARQGASARPEACAAVVDSWPYYHPRTLYLQAKETSLAAFASSPLIGLGDEGFGVFAERRAKAETGADRVSFYDTPHCAYLGVLAEDGLPGGLALLFLLSGLALLLARPGRSVLTATAAVGVVAFLVIAVNIDILGQRHWWMLLGLATGLHLSDGDTLAREGPAVLSSGSSA